MMDDSKEALLDDILKKVIEIDRRKKYDSELKDRIQDHVSALTEVTSLPQEEIEKIAQQICSEHQRGPFDLGLLLKLPKTFYISLVVFLFIGAISIWFLHFGYQKGVKDSSPNIEYVTENRRAEFIKKYLNTALSELNMVKLSYLEDYMATGNFPMSLPQLGLNETDVKSDVIDSVKFLENSGIKASLSPLFGEEKYLILETEQDKGNGHFIWRCYTNIPQKLLGAKSASFCDYRL